MRRFGAIAFLLVLAAVGAAAYFYLKDERQAGTDSITAEARLAQLEALADQTPDGAAAGENDLRALADAFSGFASVEIGSVENAPDGPFARDVVIKLENDAEVGVRVDELRAWGVNAAANGADGDARVAERFDARGVEWFGFEKLVEEQTNAYVDAIESSLGELAPEAEAEMDLDASVEQYDIGADRAIVDGLIIHAGGEPGDAEADNAETFLSVMKMIADSNRLISFDASAVYGMCMNMKFEQTTGKSDITMKAPFAAASGWRRGDLDFSAVKGLVFNMDMVIPETVVTDPDTGVTETTPEMPMQMGGGYDLFSIEDLKLARLYEYLAAGTTPPMSETDLLSLGVWRVRGERQTFGAREISSTEEVIMDLSKFHWFIPTDIRFTARGGEYNMSALLAYVGDMAAYGGAEDDAGLEQLEQAQAALRETGLDTVSYDMEMKGAWDPENGETHSQINIAGQDLGDWRQSFEGTFPDFEEVKGFLPAGDETLDWAAIGPKVLETSALKRASVVIADKGGLDKGFAMAVAMAKLAPEDDVGAAMLRNADPADLRISSAAMMRLAAPQAAQAFPPAADYITAFADFVQKGGVLRVEANPPAPLTAALLESEAETLQSDPGRFAELLGLSVVHEAPASGAD